MRGRNIHLDSWSYSLAIYDVIITIDSANMDRDSHAGIHTEINPDKYLGCVSVKIQSALKVNIPIGRNMRQVVPVTIIPPPPYLGFYNRSTGVSF